MSVGAELAVDRAPIVVHPSRYHAPLAVGIGNRSRRAVLVAGEQSRRMGGNGAKIAIHVGGYIEANQSPIKRDGGWTGTLRENLGSLSALNF